MQRKHQYAKALEYYEKCLEIRRKVGEVQGEGVTLNNIGLVYRSSGQYSKALEQYEKALAIEKKIGAVRNEGATLSNMAHVSMAMGNNDQALADLRKTLDIYTRIGVPTDGVKDSMAQAYLEKGDLLKAQEYAKWIDTLGWLSLAKSDLPGAKNNYEKLVKRAEETRNADWLFIAYTGLGRVYELQGEYPKAEEQYRRAVNGVEDLRSGLAPSERETFFTFKIQGFFRTNPYEGLGRVLSRMNRHEEALKQSEYTRARLFSEALSKRMEGTKIPVPRDVLDRESILTDQLAALTRSLQQAYEKRNKEVISSLEPQVKEKKAKVASLIDTLRKHYPLYAATRYPQPMDLSQTALKDDERVLSYDMTDSEILISLTKGETLVKGLFKPIPAGEEEGLARTVRTPLEVIPGKDKVSDKLRAFDFTACKKLSDLLLSDVLPDIPPGTPLIIVPDGSLSLIPVELLVLNTGGPIADKEVSVATNAEFFGDRNPITYYQSITALTLARTTGTSQKTKEKLLVIADPVFEMRDARVQGARSSQLAGVQSRLYEELMASVEDGKLGALRFGRLSLTGDLAADLNTCFKGSCSMYTGLKATKDTFMKEAAPHLDEYGKVVFATHGYLGTGLPGIREPVLVLSLVPPGTDGYLRMSEVMGLRMNADMVALTAGQTGLGKDLSLEGVMGMGRAFQYAGAKSVLMSLCSVAEHPSVVLVERFFRSLKEGKGKADSLRLAREEVRKQGFDHPFFWAPFILVAEVK